MGISSPGVGSGLDIGGIIRQLMSLERRPLVALQKRESAYNSELSAYGRLKSAMEAFKTAMTSLGSADKFQVYQATSGDETAFTATASSRANAGSFSVQVVELAAAHRMASGSMPDNNTTPIGNPGDRMTLTVGEKSFEVEIGGKTLVEIRGAINTAADNAGVAASILKESDSSYRLILSASESGTDKAIGVSFSNGGAPIADPLGTTTTVAARDAEILVDGAFTITSSTNTFSDAIEGVTLTVRNRTTAAVSLDIGRDTDAIKKSAQEFADAYNTLRKTVSDLRGGALKTDPTLLSIERRIQGILNTPPAGTEGSYQYLAQAGIAIQKDGEMTLDDSKFTAALETDFAGVAQLFTASGQGYAARLKAAATDMLASGGLIETRSDGINSRIRGNQNQQDALSYRLELVEQRFRRQYANLDVMLGQMQSTSNYLTAQLRAI